MEKALIQYSHKGVNHLEGWYTAIAEAKRNFVNSWLWGKQDAVRYIVSNRIDFSVYAR